METDRLKSGLQDFVQAQFPQVDYLAAYGGRVVVQRGGNSFDFEPDDPRIPSMAAIPVKLPFPGFSLQLDTAAQPRANIAWVGGDPAQPEIRLWEAPGLLAFKVEAEESVTVNAPSVNLGGDPALQPVILGTLFVAALTVVMSALSVAFAAIAAAFTAGAAAWAAAGAAVPLLAPAAAIAVPVYTATATAMTVVIDAIATFIGALDSTLSTITKTN